MMSLAASDLDSNQRSSGTGLEPNGIISLGSRLSASATSSPPLERRTRLVQPRGHSNVAADGQNPDPVLGLAEALFRDRRAKPDREPRRVHAKCLCGEEMAKLVDENHDAQDKYGCEPD